MVSQEEYVRLIRNCCPELEIRSVKPITQGWDSFVLEINGNFIFRFPLHDQAEVQHEKEKGLLTQLAPTLSIEVPQFEFDCSPEGQSFGRFVGYRKITGEPLSKGRLKPTIADVFAREIGKALSEVHIFPNDKAANALVPSFSPRQWREAYQGMYQTIQDKAFNLLDAPVQRYTQSLWEEYLKDDHNFNFQPTLVHQDLGAVHILCNYHDGKVEGIIDWGDAVIGDPAIDFVGIMIECGRGFTEQVLKWYPLELYENFWERVEFYIAAGPYHELLYGIETHQDKFVQSSVQQLHNNAQNNSQVSKKS